MVEDEEGSDGQKADEPNKGTALVLEDQKVPMRVVLAGLWTAHFLLWSFGDMMSLLQETTEVIKDDVILIVAPTTAVIQASMIFICLVGEATYVRWACLIAAPVYLLFNIGYLAEPDSDVWNYYLGIFYVLFSFLIIWHAWKWPMVPSEETA